MKYAPTRTKRARQLLGCSSCHLSILLAAVAAVAVPPVRLPKRGVPAAATLSAQFGCIARGLTTSYAQLRWYRRTLLLTW